METWKRKPKSVDEIDLCSLGSLGKIIPSGGRSCKLRLPGTYPYQVIKLSDPYLSKAYHLYFVKLHANTTARFASAVFLMISGQLWQIYRLCIKLLVSINCKHFITKAWLKIAPLRLAISRGQILRSSARIHVSGHSQVFRPLLNQPQVSSSFDSNRQMKPASFMTGHLCQRGGRFNTL